MVVSTKNKLKEFWSLHLPRKTYRKGQNYYGTFPEGFEKKLMNLIRTYTDKPYILHLCSGTSLIGNMRVDINPLSDANIIIDARKFESDPIFNWVIIDSYYTKEDYNKVNQEYVSVYDFMKVADKCLINNGYLAVLHTLPPRKPKGYKLIKLIAISMGPDRQMRCMQIFQKVCSL